MEKEKEPNPIDEASREFAIVAVTTYLFLTKNGLKADYVIELLHDSIDEITRLIKEYEDMKKDDD
mgnify:FL=1|jgi:chorismate mutase|tara:strand:+ start:272 stop:466 length:195 start_codon:yes stop_codon:yes gene_type:complete